MKNVIIIICLLISTIILAVDYGCGSSLNTDPICKTEACYNLASDILRSINTSVDPCDNFFDYVCQGWQQENNWELIKYPGYSTISSLNNVQKEIFLDVLTGNDDPLLSVESVNKSKIFFDSCYTSSIDEETIQSEQLLQDFMSLVNFSDFNLNAMSLAQIENDSWDLNNSLGFQEAMAWMIQRNWNDLFQLFPTDAGIVSFEQNILWWRSKYYHWSYMMHVTYIPLYQSLFGLTLEEAQFIADLVVDFIALIINITTIDASYFDLDLKELYIRNTTIYEINDLFGVNTANTTVPNTAIILMDYKKIILDAFECVNEDCVTEILYLEPGVQFFRDLAKVIESTSPYIVQYWFFTDILDNYFNYGLEQSRYTDRRDYCFARTRDNFPVVYGYVINQKTYPMEKYQVAFNITNNILKDGVTASMYEVDWMDAISLNASLKKAAYMDLYISLPPPMTDIDVINSYYDIDTLSLANGYVTNYAEMLEFAANHYLKLFNGEDINLHEPWPSFFSVPNYFGIWLTGVNAFYVPLRIGDEKGNWFCMPQTITQEIMFSLDYPMLVNYALWGFVVGHEITHGFDSGGSQYDEMGEKREMWTNETRNRYNDLIQCFIDQYDKIEVEPGVYVNGRRTNTENTADNGGMAASIAAYKKWKERVGLEIDADRAYLPGLNYTEEQLWWVSYGRTWCTVWRDGYYSPGNYFGVHGPANARLNGVVQNFRQFADAFNCPVNSTMNPSTKCGLWHDPTKV